MAATTTIQLDVSSANRFVSSLSKSLQALCHGCMDFDTQIEIVGYINVNIDCNGKVDCVLNEKVSKSTDNSMTFVSNSFLAKKDDPKTMKERSCSPIAELNTKIHYQGRGSSSHYRSSGIFSPHSQVVRGTQKRSLSGADWRGSQRNFAKSSKSKYDSYPNQPFHEGSSYCNNQSQQSTSYSDTSALQTEYDYTNASQEDIHIKTENPDVCDSSHQNTSSTDNQNTDSLNIIKSDPDAPETNQSQSNEFSQPTEGQNSGESFFKTESQNPENETVEQNVEGEATNQSYSGTEGDYEASEGQSYNQSMFGGDESGEASQFDIIEIDDEDEDIAAFTGEFGRSGSGLFPEYQSNSGRQPRSSHDQYQPPESELYGYETTGSEMASEGLQKSTVQYCSNTKKFCCPCCDKQYLSIGSLSTHVRIKHQGRNPFACEVCGKGFRAKAHLMGHMSSHGMPMRFKCSICGLKYAHKTSLRSHEKTAHGDR